MTKLLSIFSFFILSLAFADSHMMPDGTKMENAPSVGVSAWNVIQAKTKEIGALIEAKNLKTVHESVEKIIDASKTLKAQNPVTDTDKKKRFESALDQLVKQADKVHDTADESKDVAKTSSEYKKLQGALTLVETQLPDSYKMKMAYACPMHKDQMSATPANCPKCGMSMSMMNK